MKDIYEILNDIDIDEKEFEEDNVTEADKSRVKLNLRKAIAKKKLSGKRKAAVAASIVFLIGFSIIAVKPALAKGIQIINNLFNKSLVSVNEQYKDYIDVIGKTKSDKGIDVTLESVIADDNGLFLNFIVKNNNEKIKDNFPFIPMWLKVNGERLSTGGGGSWESIDNNTIRVLEDINWSLYNKNDKMNIDIDIDWLFGKKGNWGVSFFVDKSKLAKNTIQYNINKKIEINEIKGEIDNVIVSPLTISINGTGDINKYVEAEHYVDFIAFDDKGSGLLWNGSGNEGKGNSYNWSTHFINTENSKNVTIIPVYIMTNEKVKKLPSVKLDFNTAAKPVVLPIDIDRSIKIKNYFIEDNYLVVKYVQQYEGKEALMNVANIPMYLIADGTEMQEHAMTDNKGEEIYRKYDNRKEPVHVYKIGKARDISIGIYDGSNIKIMKDKSITVKTK